MSIRRRVAAVLVMAVMMPAGSAWASSDAAVRWTSFSESTTCGVTYTGTPIMSRTGILSNSERILGPLGGYFGRTVGAVRADQVYWTVPMSGGRRVLVNRQALAAFNQVTKNLAAEQAAGRFYSITNVAAFTPRTIGGARQLSRHTFGTAIDINPAQNPYTSDPDRLVTNMPGWFVDAWREAGFCWGGDWATAKDAMHFSWLGPQPGAGVGLDVRAPSGSQKVYADAASYETAWGDLAATGSMMLADLGGFGALDVARLRPHAEGAVLDVVPGRSGFSACSSYRWFVPGVVASELTTMGDIDGDSRTDLVVVDPAGTVTLVPRAGGFGNPVSYPIELPADPLIVAVGDRNGDRKGELFIVGADGTVNVLTGDRFEVLLETFQLAEAPVGFTIGDRDGDGSIELFSFLADGTASVLDPDGLVEVDRVTLPGPGVVAVGAADQDGDGRSDLSRLDGAGMLNVAVGNTATGRSVSSWWIDPFYKCSGEAIPLSWSGTFYDDDRSEFAGDIELVASLGITRGCNPPFGDAYCPADSVTRGQMAAFLVRMFGLAGSPANAFTDDDGSVFESDINLLAAAGITTGCTSTAFCPNDPVTRGQMAAFLVRGLGMVGDTSSNRFVDDDQSVFEDQIELLAEAGVTRGCDPPQNSRFCPADVITRGQMAAFLGRATLIE